MSAFNLNDFKKSYHDKAENSLIHSYFNLANFKRIDYHDSNGEVVAQHYYNRFSDSHNVYKIGENICYDFSSRFGSNVFVNNDGVVECFKTSFGFLCLWREEEI